MQHTTVLLHEAVDGLELTASDTVVDATFGGGGHGREIVKRLGKGGRYIGIDADSTALDIKQLGECEAHINLVHDNFAHVSTVVSSLHIEQVDAILADLGWRMDQFANGEKGFSFMYDGPLYMTFGDPDTYDFTAADIVNSWDEHVLADIFYGYAQERFARRIAKAIVDARKREKILTTFQLAALVRSAYPAPALRNQAINPATKVFQALRIAVNNELGVLETFIKEGFALLKPGGRFAIITFHSIEDRVVKHSFRELADAQQGTLTPKKPIVPSREELKTNPRARSAKLRIITKH